jgi:GcrA cell cycle regulator
MSSSRIADDLSNEFGVKITRNMVCGKAFRLGLILKGKGKNGENKTTKAKPQKLHKTIFYPRPEPVGIPAEPIAIPESRRVSIYELTFTSCRWPLGDPRDDDFAFCGADRANPYDDSNAYCAGHAATGYRPSGPVNMRPVRQANSTRAGVNS